MHPTSKHATQLDNGVDVLLVQDSGRGGDQTVSTELEEHQNSRNSEKHGSKKNNEWLPPGVSDEDDDEFDPMCACAVVLKIGSVSYTHLTLPTKA